MTASGTHAAKVRALQALHAGRLSVNGSRRVSAHMADCETCQSAMRGIRLHEHLTRNITDAPTAIDFSRMDLALRREAAAVSRRRRAQRWLLPLSAAAAAALLVWGVSSRPLAPRTATAPHPPSAAAPSKPAPLSTPLVGYVTLLRGAATQQSGTESPRALSIDSQVREGERLNLEAQAAAELLLRDATAVGLEGGSKLKLQALRSNDIELALEAGAVTSRVRKLEAGARFRVRALGYSVEVRGTLFRVSVQGGRLAVSVEEGHVVVLDAQGRLTADLVAPAVFEQPASAASVRHTLETPRALTLPLTAWPPLGLPVLKGVVSWKLDGRILPASAALAMRVPRGRVELGATLLDGTQRSAWLQVPEGGAQLDEVSLRRLMKLQDEPTARSPTADAGSLQRVVAAGTPALQRCYEHSLKLQPGLSGRLLLRFIVDARGRVRSVSPRAPSTDAQKPLLQCIQMAAMRWSFPPPGGSGVTFDAPILLEKGR